MPIVSKNSLPASSLWMSLQIRRNWSLNQVCARNEYNLFSYCLPRQFYLAMCPNFPVLNVWLQISIGLTKWIWTCSSIIEYFTRMFEIQMQWYLHPYGKKKYYLGRIKIDKLNTIHDWMDCFIAWQYRSSITNAFSADNLYETRVDGNHEDYFHNVFVFTRINPKCRWRNRGDANTFNT